MLGNTIYAEKSDHTGIAGYSVDGTQVSLTPIPNEAEVHISFTALSDGRFAILDNQYDRIYFIDSSGNLLHTSLIRSQRDFHSQNVYGLQVGNQLLVSEDGDMNVLSVDLTTYDVTTFKSVGNTYGWLSDIACADGTYYVGTDTHLLKFTQDGPVTSVGTITSGSITGIAIKDGYAYLSSNGGNEIYRMGLSTGVSQDWATGINYPQDLELGPTFALEPAALVITGTPNADTIHLVQSGDDLAVTVNGATSHYSVAQISSLTINALGGNDTVTLSGTIPATISGGQGNDLISGGSGNDLIYGGAGNDSTYGNAGADTIYGGMGNDLLYGGTGADSICGQGQSDSIFGGAGNDTLAGGAGNDYVNGGAGDDVVRVHDSVYFIDTVDGGAGNDQVTRNATDMMLGCETDTVL